MLSGDYISKSALIEHLNLYEKELFADRKDAIDSDDEMMLFAISNQYTAINRITKSILYELPTLNEKEIIRKYGEQIVKKLEDNSNFLLHEMGDSKMYAGNESAIEIVKEECGINE